MKFLLVLLMFMLGKGSILFGQEKTFLKPDSNLVIDFTCYRYTNLLIKKKTFNYQLKFISREGEENRSNFIEIPPHITVDDRLFIYYLKDTFYLHSRYFEFMESLTPQVLLPINASKGGIWNCNYFGYFPGQMEVVEKEFITLLNEFLYKLLVTGGAGLNDFGVNFKELWLSKKKWIYDD